MTDLTVTRRSPEASWSRSLLVPQRRIKSRFLPDSQKICGGAGTSDERLIEESFRYLLEHEPNTSILRKFSIDQIENYFPDGHLR